ncbi:MAG: hypothetical protein J7M34_08635 [Anaerolineae bacterium]|nr:hypothetical protein [Anaerolineae bacterium]
MAKRRGHGEGTIYRRKDGTHLVQISLGNGRRLSKYFKTRKEAQDWRIEALNQQRLGTLPSSSQITVQQFFEHWLEVSVKPSVKIRVYDRYEQLVRNHLYPYSVSTNCNNLERITCRHFMPWPWKRFLREPSSICTE